MAHMATVAGMAAGSMCRRATAMPTVTGIPVLQLTGTPHNRGEIQGETLRKEIQALLAAWRSMLQQKTGIEADAIIQDIMAHTQYQSMVQRHTPALWEELAGIAKAAEVGLDTLFVFNLPDEQQWYLQAKAVGMHLPTQEKCTTLGFDSTRDMPALMGQNMDIASASNGFGVLLDIRDTVQDLCAYAFNIAGLIGMVGMNNQGLGVANNSLRQLDGRADGLPVNFIVRRLLEMRTANSAIQFLKTIPHANGHNWMIGDKIRVRSFECSARSVVEFTPPQFPGLVYHTNHPFENADTTLYDRLRADAVPVSGSSEARCAVLERLLQAHGKNTPSVAFVKAVLSNRDHSEYPICRPHAPDNPDASYTAASLVMELAETPVLHLAPGPPCEIPYTAYSLE